MTKVRLNKVQAARGLGIVILTLMVAAVYLLVLSPRLSQAAAIRDETVQAKMANTGARDRLAVLKESSAAIDAKVPLANRLIGLFPPDADQEQMFRQIKDAAVAAGITDFDLAAVTPSVPVFGVVNSSGGTVPAASAAAGTPVTVGTTPNAIASQSLHITGNASPGEFLALVSNLQNLDRAFLITSVKYSPGSASVNIDGLLFMLPKPVNPNDPPVVEPEAPSVPGSSILDDPNVTQEERELSGGLVVAN